MARLPRLSVAGQLHLVAQRGAAGQALFVDAPDRANYVSALRDAARQCAVAVHAYALLEAQVLLLLTPAEPIGLTRAMQSTARRYVGGFNSRHGRKGSVWGGRFRSAVVEPAFLLSCMAYVEQAPVRQGLAASAGEWAWSSAPHHLGRRPDPLITEHPDVWRLGNTPFEREARYRDFLERALTAKEFEAIRASLDGGWVLGSDAFAHAMAQGAARRVRPLDRGRPKKISAT